MITILDKVLAELQTSALLARSSLSITSYGAKPLAGYDNYTAIQNAINAAIAAGFTEVTAPPGLFEVSQKIQCKSAYLTLNFAGVIAAQAGFTDDYLISIESGGQAEEYTPQFYHPVITSNLKLRCNFLTRGMSVYNVDHANLDNVRVENAWGTAFNLDRLRESTLYMPLAINCAHRESFADGDLSGDWDSGTSWLAGNIVRYRPATYAGGTTYAAGTVVLDGGFNWISAENGNIGNTPAVTSAFWRKVPHQDYKCLIANTNKTPLTFNTNDPSVGNHYWQKVYQDEALFNVVDEVVGTGDRQNQVTLYSPICRDSDNKCLMRIDNNRNSSSNTHINIYSGHLHHIGVAALGEYAEITGQSDTRCIEIGRTINCNIHGTNLFNADRPQGIACLIGDLGSKKSASIRIQASLGSDGANQTGLIVMPSVVGSDLNIVEPAYVENSPTNVVQYIDPVRFTRKYSDSEIVIRMPHGRPVTPTGIELVGASDFDDPRYITGRKNADSGDRIRVETTVAGTTRIGMGAGSGSPDAYIERRGANRVAVGTGDSFEIDGTWNAPFRLGTMRMWVSGSDIYIKLSAPSSATDGTILGTV